MSSGGNRDTALEENRRPLIQIYMYFIRKNYML